MLLIALLLMGQTPADNDANLDRMRGILKASRLAANDKLEQQGSLTATDLSAVKSQASNAYTVWSACLLSHSFAAPKPGNLDMAVNSVMRSCIGDRAEMLAWMRFGIKASGESATKAEYDARMAEFDRSQRAHVREKLLSK
jgi:hypothetical protein